MSACRRRVLRARRQVGTLNGPKDKSSRWFWVKAGVGLIAAGAIVVAAVVLFRQKPARREWTAPASAPKASPRAPRPVSGAFPNVLRWMDRLAWSGSPWQRAEAAAELGKARSALAVPILLEALEDEFLCVRCSAALALGDIGDDRAVEALTAALDSRDGELVLASALALSDLGQAGAPAGPRLLALLAAPPRLRAEPLRRLAQLRAGRLHDRVPSLEPDMFRLSVIASLGAIGERGAVPALSRLVEGGDAAVAGPAAQALARLGAVEALLSAAGKGSLPAFVELVGLREPRAVPLLLAAAGSADKSDRAEIVRLLGMMRDPRGLETLLAALGDAEEEVRTAAAAALGELKDPKAIPTLVKLLNGPAPVSQPAGPATQTQATQPQATQPQTTQPQASQPQTTQPQPIQAPAALAIAQIGGPEARKVLDGLAGHPSAEVRAAVAIGLGQFSDERAIETLIRFLDDPAPGAEWVMRPAWAAKGSLRQIGAAAVGSLTKALAQAGQPGRRRIVEVLAAIEPLPKDAVPLIRPFADDRDGQTRSAAVEVLWRQRDPALAIQRAAAVLGTLPGAREADLPGIRDALDRLDAGDPAYWTLLRRLADLDSSEAIRRLRKHLAGGEAGAVSRPSTRPARPEPVEERAAGVLRGIVPAPVEQVAGLLEHPGDLTVQARKELIALLGEFGDPRAAGVLARYAREGSGLEAEADEALGRVGGQAAVQLLIQAAERGRASAAGALAQSADRRGVETIVRLLDDRRYRHRALVASSLHGVLAEEIAAALRRLAAGDDEGLRSAATAALEEDAEARKDCPVSADRQGLIADR